MLDGATVLDDWAPTLSPQGLRLVGYATGHPVFGEGVVRTSPLCFADPGGAWVRTLSGFYLLGRSVDPKDIRRMLRISSTIGEDNDHWEDEQE